MFEEILQISLSLKDYLKSTLKNKIGFNNLLLPFQNQISFLLIQFEDLINIFNIERATSIRLDLIGLFVGQERITSSFVNGNFVFDSEEFGFDQGIFDVGGDYIDDTKYRFLLKAKIIKDNTKDWARDEIILYHKTLLGNEEVFEVIEDTLSVNIKFINPLEDFSYQVLDKYPLKIGGVTISYEVPA